MIRRFPASRELVLFVVLIGLLVGFSAGVEGFSDIANIMERSRYWVVPGMIALPMTLVIATGGIDLSVGSTLGMSGVVLGLLFRDAGWPIALASLAAVLTGFMAGTLNGGASTCLKIPPLVVTLATMALYSGVSLMLSQARPIGEFPAMFQWLGQGDLFRVNLGMMGTITFPAPILGLVLVSVIGWAVLRCNMAGRYAECIGENEVAARFAAIDVGRLKWVLYAVTGGVCGIASIFCTSLYATARPEAGRGVELEAIACVVIGGTHINGGQATITGTILGMLIIGVLRYGLEMAMVPSQYLVILVGVLLIVTAAFNEWLIGKGELEP